MKAAIATHLCPLITLGAERSVFNRISSQYLCWAMNGNQILQGWLKWLVKEIEKEKEGKRKGNENKGKKEG